MGESRKMVRPPWAAVTGTGDIASGSIISLVAEAWYTDIIRWEDPPWDQNCSTNVRFPAHHPQIHNQTGMSDSW